MIDFYICTFIFNIKEKWVKILFYFVWLTKKNNTLNWHILPHEHIILSDSYELTLIKLHISELFERGAFLWRNIFKFRLKSI